MNTFAERRRFNLGIVLVGVLLSWMAFAILEASLRDTAMWTGALLLLICVVLTALNLRKKLPFLALGTAALWLEVHCYLAVFSILVFVAHVGWVIPTGPLESILALLFLAVATTGLFGLFISRSFPRRLAAHGEPVLFERIPRLRLLLRGEVEDLVFQAAHEDQTTTLSDFYAEHLADYLREPKFIFANLVDSERPYALLVEKIEALDRYLSPSEREILAEIHERVELKGQLDRQFALQGALKGWFFVHIPLTYCLMIFVLLHAALVLGFQGGLR